MPTTQPNIGTVAPLQFQADIHKRRCDIEAAHMPPDQLVQLLMARLSEYRSVTPETIVDVVRAVRAYESERQLLDGKKLLQIFRLPKTGELIDELLPLVKGDGRIESTLLAERGQTLDAEGNLEKAAIAYRSAASVAGEVGLAADVRKVESLEAHASCTLRSGAKAAARESCLKVLSYDWYKARDPEAIDRLKTSYLRAGHMLIDLSRHDAAALKQIFFVPAAMGELGPPLQQAIREAGSESNATRK